MCNSTKQVTLEMRTTNEAKGYNSTKQAKPKNVFEDGPHLNMFEYVEHNKWGEKQLIWFG